MAEPRTGSELLIVDNSDEHWKLATYLKEWAEISNQFDVATGHFEIGGLLAIDGAWQKVDGIRILLGDVSTLRTQQAFQRARESQIARLDESLEQTKLKNHFLEGVPAVVEALRSGKIRCRIYRKERFHAKAYITHGRSEVVGAFALVGSSNLSAPGLTDNVELNVQIVGAAVHTLQQWYEKYWDEAEEFTPEVTRAIERHVAEYTPFDVYAKALQEFFRGHELTDTEWEESRSKMFARLDRYQKEAYWSLMKIARQHGGAFLCDGVGLGKTFVGLMLIERLILREGKRVALFAPKAVREGVWDRDLRKYLPHIGGASVYSSLGVFNHTDLNRGGEFPEKLRRVAELADVVIIDEAHHFRNTGRVGNAEEGVEPSRYHRLFELLGTSDRRKTVYMLTATPINNRLSDLRHLIELFTQRDEAYFAGTLGVNNLSAHFVDMDKALRKSVGQEAVDVEEHADEAKAILATDTIFKTLVVQRSRAYARESQLREKGETAMFPERKPPRVAEYSIRKTYGRLLDSFESAFSRKNPLFTLPMYYPLAWYKGPDKSIDPWEENRQRAVVGLIRTNFLKRFESSVVAFDTSCSRLMRKLLAFLEKNCATAAETKRLAGWKAENAEILNYAVQRELDLLGEDAEESADDDVVPQEMLEGIERLDRDEFDVPAMIAETYHDLKQIAHFLEELRKFEPQHDDKLQKLVRLLKSKELTGEKVLIFTEFADTARYLKRRLVESKIDGVDEVDSGSKKNRADTIQRFAPYYNESSSGALAKVGREEIRILISTDVLSEGLNLQDAARLVNYDIHWNPVRLMQRIGRVDRRMNPETEARLVADHPEAQASRGKVTYWNFLPPDELNAILTLYTKVTQKTLLISRTLGIEGRKLLHPEDIYDDLKVFNAFDSDYEGKRTAIEDMHLEYQAMLEADPTLEGRLKAFPGETFSGRKRVPRRTRGVFFCYSLPALDAEKGEFTEAAGTSRWYLADLERDAIYEEPGEIVESIRSKPDTPRRCTMTHKTLADVRARVEKHIKNTYLKRVDAPVGVRGTLKCWMELNEG